MCTLCTLGPAHNMAEAVARAESLWKHDACIMTSSETSVLSYDAQVLHQVMAHIDQMDDLVLSGALK